MTQVKRRRQRHPLQEATAPEPNPQAGEATARVAQQHLPVIAEWRARRSRCEELRLNLGRERPHEVIETWRGDGGR
jgi:hypothetical protein